MMNKAWNKIKQAWEWTKRNVKKVLVGLGIVTVALAVGGTITTISVNVNGKTIQFKNCETIEKNGIAICSDKSVYSGWDSVTNYVRINNQTKQPFVNLAPYAKKAGFKIKSVKKLKQDVVVKKEQRYLKSTSIHIHDIYDSSSSTVVDTKKHIHEKYDTRTVTTTEDRWVDLKLSKSNQRNYKIPPGKAKGIHKKNAEYFPHNQTKVFTDGVEYLKLKLSVPPRQSQLPYLIKAFNSQGFAYLDPTVDSTWDGRFDITASSSYAGTHTDFPLYYNGNNRPADCADEGIRVTTSSKTGSEVLDMETVATGTAGSWEIYFKDPSASAGETYYVWCKNGGTSYSTSNVWSDKYMAVYHLNGDPSTDSTTDSTSNNNDGSTEGNPVSTTTAQVGNKAYAFDGSGDAIKIPNDTSLNIGTGSTTLFAWANLPDTTNFESISDSRDDTNNYAGYAHYQNNGHPGFTFRSSAGNQDANSCDGTTDFTTGNFENSVITRQNGTINCYFNGSNIYSQSGNQYDTDGWSNLYLGERGSDDAGSLSGVIDEVRLLDEAQATSTISDQYNMMKDNANFWTVGTWQATGGGAEAPARRNNTIIY